MDYNPPRGPEDTVQYRVCMPGDSDGSSAPATLRTCMDVVQVLTRNVIWHRDPFQLFLHTRSDISTDLDQPAAWLEGTTCFADNIDDEWLVVALLFELTKRFDGLVATAVDGDGEFLLIEAANELPAWLDPDTSENRVYIHKGQLHIIPLPDSPATLDVFPTGRPLLTRALSLVVSSVRTEAANSVQDVIAKRVGSVADYVANNHRVRCYVPEKIARVLSTAPHLISPAITAFYERDPIDMKHCLRMAVFPPDSRVMAEVTMTRCLYAQLLQQRFHGSKVFGFMPQPSSADYKAHDLGTKIACGFEILVHRSSPGSDAEVINFTSSPQWQAYVNRLEQLGYFQGNIQGSKEYRRLMEVAKVKFINDMYDEKGPAPLARQFLASQTLREVLSEIDVS